MVCGFDGVAFVGAGIVVKGGSANITNHDFLKFLNASTAGGAHIANSGNVSFYNSSTAGSAKFTNDNVIQFFDTSTAGRAHITNNWHRRILTRSKAGRAHITNGFNANVEFFNDSTAAKSVIINNYILNFNHSSTAGAAHITNTGTILFLNNSTAGSATINSAIGGIAFLESSNAGNASITGSVRFYGNTTAGTAVVTPVDGGKVSFFDFSTGGGARFIAKVGTTVDFSQSGGIGGVITAGSIEGAGDYELNGSGGKLRVGFNNRSTKVSGAVDDTGGGTGAVLQKVGTGTLTLSHAGNTYSGGTVLTQGTLDIAAQGAAGTGAIYFDVGRQTLKIENTALANHAFSNVIGLFSVVDKIDLAGLKFVTHAKAHYDTVTHLLTVKSGHVTDTLTLITPGNGTFKAKDDGHGGTKVVLVPPACEAHRASCR